MALEISSMMGKPSPERNPWPIFFLDVGIPHCDLKCRFWRTYYDAKIFFFENRPLSLVDKRLKIGVYHILYMGSKNFFFSNRLQCY